MIYLDHNATTLLRPEAREAMLPWLGERTGNPASAHGIGRQARRALEDARDRVAALLGAASSEVVFTSGATEANNLAVFGLCGEAGHILASPIEHPCVVEPIKHLATRGFTVDWLPVNGEGVVEPDAVRRLVRAETRLVAVMLANHETGAIQPVAECTGSVPLHVDAAQAVGKIPIAFHDLGAATLSVSGHKLGGPAGIGALLVNRCVKLKPMLYGGHQQRGRRPGTEPVALAVGFAAALDAAVREMANNHQRMLELRRRFLEAIRGQTEPVIVNGPIDAGLPHVLNLSFPGCSADAMLMALDLAGVACSTGSACSSGSLLPSPVLQAMGISGERLRSAMRFSLGWPTTATEIDEAAGIIGAVVTRLRNTSSAEEQMQADFSS